MNFVKLDLKNGLIFLDSAPIVVDDKGALADSIAKLCSPPAHTNSGLLRYHLLRKVSVCGKGADCVIEVDEKRLNTITFLFEFIEFFESNVLESKVLRACEKSLNVTFLSNHPTTAISGPYEWGQAQFFYDAKQGDLSLEIIFDPKLIQ
jgi:hypothetical protein